MNVFMGATTEDSLLHLTNNVYNRCDNRGSLLHLRDLGVKGWKVPPPPGGLEGGHCILAFSFLPRKTGLTQ